MLTQPTTADANCLSMSPDLACLVCRDSFYNEYSGKDTTPPLCFYQSACQKVDPISPSANIRSLYAYTTTNGSTRYVCRERPKGCMISSKPLTCDLCQPFKSHKLTNYSCECTLMNCQADKCDQSACEACESGYQRIFIERSTSQFQCLANSSCTEIYGEVAAPNITSTIGTPWCKHCEDENCGNCMADFLTCVKCKSNYYMSTTNLCTKCDDTCNFGITQAKYARLCHITALNAMMAKY